MNDLHEDKYSMYLGVKGVLNMEENRSIWNSDPFFVELMGEFTKLMDEILELMEAHGMAITWSAREKKEVRDELIGAAMKVVYGGVAHAVITNDPELESMIDYRKRDLLRARDVALADKARVIYEVAYPLRNELAARYVTEEDIEQVRVLKERFDGLIAAPRLNIIVRKGATDALKVKFRAVDVLLRKRIDVIILVYKHRHEDFVNQYFDVRKLVRTGVRHTGAWVRGRVVVAGSETGVAGARVLMSEKKRERVTDEGGYFKFLLKRKCKVSLVAEAAGFKRAVKDKIGIVPGKGVEVVLEVVVSAE